MKLKLPGNTYQIASKNKLRPAFPFYTKVILRTTGRFESSLLAQRFQHVICIEWSLWKSRFSTTDIQ